MGISISSVVSGELAVVDVVTASAEDWVREHAGEMRAAITERGAVLVRGLGVGSAADVAAIAGALGVVPMVEREGFAPRSDLGHGVCGSSQWPSDQPMCMHHELSYATDFPSLMIFGCLRAPVRGGVTAVADARAVLASLPRSLVERFARHGWLLVRSYNDLLGVSWQDAFGVTERSEVERYCAQNDVEFTWKSDGTLVTRQHRPALMNHPVTGESCWFNQIAFLNEWTMESSVREFLRGEFGPDGLPFTTFSGDGEPLDEETVAIINDAYERHTVREPWQNGDVLLVDNIGTAHSREPYAGEREIAVVLAEPARRR